MSAFVEDGDGNICRVSRLPNPSGCLLLDSENVIPQLDHLFFGSHLDCTLITYVFDICRCLEYRFVVGITRTGMLCYSRANAPDPSASSTRNVSSKSTYPTIHSHTHTHTNTPTHTQPHTQTHRHTHTILLSDYWCIWSAVFG